MRTNMAILTILAGLGLSIAGEAIAEARNLSCISGISPNERRLLRDCGPEPKPVQYAVEIVDETPPPPPTTFKNGESGKDRGGRTGGNAGNGNGSAGRGGGTAAN